MHAEVPVSPEVAVRVTDAIQRAGDWALVLHSAAIDHRVDIRDGAVVLIVAADDVPRALAVLDAFDAESRPVIDVPVPTSARVHSAWRVRPCS